MRSEHALPAAAPSDRVTTNADRGAATLGTVASVGALFSAAACCVLPLALGALGMGAGGLAAVVPFHWPLTIVAIIAVGSGWLLYARKKRACVRDATCTAAPPTRATFAMLCVASVAVSISAVWTYLEAPLMRLLGGA